MMMSSLAVVCGIIFGTAFGLTGVGSVFAVPLLVYGIGLAPHQAVCVAMIGVSFLSLINSILRWRGTEIQFRAGAILAAVGMLGAPLGAWLGRQLTGSWLMLVFASLLIVVALQIMVGTRPANLPSSRASAGKGTKGFTLAVAGLTTGVLAGLLGVGGLIVVPSLILLARIEIHCAIATSLSVVFWIGLSAVTSHLLAGQRVPLIATTLFVSGGGLGMIAGVHLGKKVSGRGLHTVFAIAMLAVAGIILVRTLRN